MKFIRPCVGEKEAWKRLHRRRPLWALLRGCGKLLRRLWGWHGHLARASVNSQINSEHCSDARANRSRPLPHLELVWLPCYRLTFEVTRRGRQSTAQALVGGHDRQVHRLNPARLQWEEADDRETFRPEITANEAVELASQGLGRSLRRGPLLAGIPRLTGLRDSEQVHYPYWVYYYERRKGRLDFRMLDAVTAAMAGPKVKAALLVALRQQRAESSASQTSKTADEHG